jgi:hypothetical protein
MTFRYHWLRIVRWVTPGQGEVIRWYPHKLVREAQRFSKHSASANADSERQRGGRMSELASESISTALANAADER